MGEEAKGVKGEREDQVVQLQGATTKGGTRGGWGDQVERRVTVTVVSPNVFSPE